MFNIIYNFHSIDDKNNYDIGYYSNMLRSYETIQLFNCKKIIKSRLINEIDYGLVEGLSLEILRNKFPNLIKLWSEKKDPKFPEGECQNDVLKRIKKFFSNVIDLNKNTLIISHLVTLRMVLVYLFQIEIFKIYKVKFDYLESFELYYYNGNIIPNIPVQLRKKIRTQLVNNE